MQPIIITYARTQMTHHAGPPLFARISSTSCEDIVNKLRGYRQQAARISSTPCEDIVTKSYTTDT